MALQFPNTKSTKDEIREAIGQTATFYLGGTFTACPTCSGLNHYDEINEASLDSWCTTCSGSYWIVTELTSGIVAHVRWRTGDEPQYGIAGESFAGDCIITIDINALTSNQISSIIEIRADSKRLVPFRTVKRGVPTRDRVRFLCREFSKDV